MHSAASFSAQSAAVAAILEGARDVVLQNDKTEALSNEPWLKFRAIEAFPPGGFVHVRYASSIFDAPVRPVLRFWLGDGSFRDHILPAACEGAGCWIGRTPEGRTGVWISPTNQPGPFAFEVTEIRSVSIWEIVRRAARAPKRLFFAASAGMVGLREEAELNWRWALGAQSCAHYPHWRAERRRSLDLSAIDRPRCDWSVAPRICAIIDIRDASSTDIDATLTSLEAQIYPNWRALFVGAPSDPAAAEQAARWTRDPNVAGFADGEPGFQSKDVLCHMLAGDRLEESAFACATEYFARHAEKMLAYADETHGEGDAIRVGFKPGWSPTLHRSVGYIGRSAFFRAARLRSDTRLVSGAPEETVAELIGELGDTQIGALRRPLFAPRRATTPPMTPLDAAYAVAAPSVAIVIPSRDRPDLLGACLKSLFEQTRYKNFKVTVVDNESADPRAHALLKRYAAEEERFAAVPSPGPFNFSALCNLGAEKTPGDFLLFLNNDTEIQTPDWIERLLFFATQADVGAVGAKLLFPSRKTQHVGVVLGMGGVAGHFGAGLDERAPGWMQRNLAPHEVSSVTGACLMVERRKFNAVGGFDSVNLPVELNDVDMCLRLAERGWRTIANTRVELIHRQSASRGGPMRLQSVYDKERRYFFERWRAVIRDDPYFHPGLSLYSYEVELP